MPTFGRYGSFPMRFGGTRNRASKAVTTSLLAEYEPGLDIDDSQLAFLEAYAEAQVIAAGWAASRRLSLQFQPLKMCEALPIWEQATQLRPTSQETLKARRADLAAKFRGQATNYLSDISDACAILCGVNFVSIQTTAPTNEITYWQCVNPGPPGLEWSSNVMKLHVQLVNAGITADAFDALIARLKRMLDVMVPAWMTFDFYVSDFNGSTEGFFLDQSPLDVTGL